MSEQLAARHELATLRVYERLCTMERQRSHTHVGFPVSALWGSRGRNATLKWQCACKKLCPTGAIDFDQRVAPLVKKVETLRVILEQDMPRALAFLDSATELMHRYTESSDPGDRPPEPTESSTNPEEQTSP